MTVQTITPQLADRVKVESGVGVVVTEVQLGSTAAMTGIQVGTVIFQANRKKINNAAEFIREIKENSANKKVLLLVRSNQNQRYVLLEW